MPLSEHEQRLLEQMERALYADDPKLASTLRGARGAHSRRRLLIGGVGVLAGLGLLVGGVAAQQWILGVAGFLVMLASAWLASTGWQSRGSMATTGEPTQPSRGKAAKSGFMRRMEQRWDRRRDELGG
jgi:hypothetical protein